MAVILVVEDERLIRDIIVEALGALGHEVRAAGTAEAAVAMVQRDRPDAILLDMALPDAAGTETLERLRNERPDVPIIMLTGNADEALAKEALKRGAFDYMTKPFSVLHLERVLEAALAS
jgi:DNA-binding response OmpR family regulator